jgi:hypothetical protein
MNPNDRNQGSKQSDKSGKDKTIDEQDRSQQSQQSGNQRGSQQGSQSGSQSGSQQQGQPGQKQSNDASTGYGRTPGAGGKLAADDDMDDDTGLSNTANRQSARQEQGNRQSEQSNVGRRDDGTPD